MPVRIYKIEIGSRFKTSFAWGGLGYVFSAIPEAGWHSALVTSIPGRLEKGYLKGLKRYRFEPAKCWVVLEIWRGLTGIDLWQTVRLARPMGG